MSPPDARPPAPRRPGRAGPVTRLVVLAGALAAATTSLAAGTVGAGATGYRLAPTVHPNRTQGAPAGPPLTLVRQSPSVTSPSVGVPGTFSVTVAVSRTLAARGGLALDLLIDNRLTARSSLEQDFTTPPSGVLDATGAQSLATTLAGPAGPDGLVTLTVAIATTNQEVAPTGQSLLDLDCAPGTCSGVYPLVVELEHDGNRVDRFTTFLTYVEQASPTPLEVSVVLPVTEPVRYLAAPGHSAASAAPHLDGPALAGARTLVAALVQHPSVPVTADVDPRTVQGLETAGAVGRAVVHQLSGLSQQSADQFPAQPYAPISPAGLEGAGLGAEISAQRRAGSAILGAARIRTRAGVWVSFSPPGSDLAPGLARLGATRVVVPAADLAQATELIDGDAVTWSEPFRLALGPGPSVAAAVADHGLSALFTADPGDPALAANQLLADLAFIHFEVPGAKSRGVVVAAPPSWAADAVFLNALLGGLTDNPVLAPGTLDHFFNTVPVGNHGSPRQRRPAHGGPGPSLPGGLAGRLAGARARLNGFAEVQRGAPVVVAGLAQLLLAAEAQSLGAGGQQAAVGSFERALSAQLGQFTLSNDRTLTLTAQTARIPVTILSSAPYGLVAELDLSSDKFQFPHGADHRDVVIDHPTTVIPILVEARTIGDLPLVVTLRSPSGDLVIARARITVRSTATSVVGIVLTLAAAAVLLVWWARTWRSGRAAKRRARAEPA